VGSVIGGLAVIFLGAIGFFIWRRRPRNQKSVPDPYYGSAGREYPIAATGGEKKMQDATVNEEFGGRLGNVSGGHLEELGGRLGNVGRGNSHTAPE
jgi:hypothetical protein